MKMNTIIMVETVLDELASNSIIQSIIGLGFGLILGYYLILSPWRKRRTHKQKAKYAAKDSFVQMVVGILLYPFKH